MFWGQPTNYDKLPMKEAKLVLPVSLRGSLVHKEICSLTCLHQYFPYIGHQQQSSFTQKNGITLERVIKSFKRSQILTASNALL